MRRALLAAASLLWLAACGGTMHGGYEAYLAQKGVDGPVSVQSFPHCHGYGCLFVSRVKLGPRDWRAIDAPFRSVHSAAEERAAIARAIAVFEQRVGALTGTAEDIAGTYARTGMYQHDCVDESINTTIYLALLAKRGKLKFHDVGTPTARVFLTSLSLGPHQAAVIAEKKSGARFVVDSWFHDNGEMPEIVPLHEWMRGWSPEKSG